MSRGRSATGTGIDVPTQISAVETALHQVALDRSTTMPISASTGPQPSCKTSGPPSGWPAVGRLMAARLTGQR